MCPEIEICLGSTFAEAVKTMLRKEVTIQGSHIDFYPVNPFNHENSSTERVVIKDLLFWEPDSLVSELHQMSNGTHRTDDPGCPERIEPSDDIFLFAYGILVTFLSAPSLLVI